MCVCKWPPVSVREQAHLETGPDSWVTLPSGAIFEKYWKAEAFTSVRGVTLPTVLNSPGPV